LKELPRATVKGQARGVRFKGSLQLGPFVVLKRPALTGCDQLLYFSGGRTSGDDQIGTVVQGIAKQLLSCDPSPGLHILAASQAFHADDNHSLLPGLIEHMVRKAAHNCFGWIGRQENRVQRPVLNAFEKDVRIVVPGNPDMLDPAFLLGLDEGIQGSVLGFDPSDVLAGADIVNLPEIKALETKRFESLLQVLQRT
jgi:hypothetical protein